MKKKKRSKFQVGYDLSSKRMWKDYCEDQVRYFERQIHIAVLGPIPKTRKRFSRKLICVSSVEDSGGIS